MPLITLTQLRTFKPQLSVNSNNRVEERYDAMILESEFKDVRPLLGTKLYQDLVQNSADAIYQTLLNGGTYNFNNFDYDNPGLNRVLAEFAFSRIIFIGSETYTPFGSGVKQYDDTVSTDRNRAKELSPIRKAWLLNTGSKCGIFLTGIAIHTNTGMTAIMSCETT